MSFKQTAKNYRFADVFRCVYLVCCWDLTYFSCEVHRVYVGHCKTQPFSFTKHSNTETSMWWQVWFYFQIEIKHWTTVLDCLLLSGDGADGGVCGLNWQEYRLLLNVHAQQHNVRMLEKPWQALSSFFFFFQELFCFSFFFKHTTTLMEPFLKRYLTCFEEKNRHGNYNNISIGLRVFVSIFA